MGSLLAWLCIFQSVAKPISHRRLVGDDLQNVVNGDEAICQVECSPAPQIPSR
jgi:hypothetical protein